MKPGPSFSWSDLEMLQPARDSAGAKLYLGYGPKAIITVVVLMLNVGVICYKAIVTGAIKLQHLRFAFQLKYKRH